LANLVYGVSGEGSGHSSRAREMINHLEQLGHTVKVVSYDRGYCNLKNDFDVFETEGLHIASSDNRVSKVKTFYLRKPYLALPMHGQFEQELNAFWMAKLNYGTNLRRIRSEVVGNFLYRLPDFEEKLNEYHAADNSAIKAKLGELLKNDCALVKAYHLRRKK